MINKTNKIISTLDELPLLAKEIIEKYPDERIFAFFGEMGTGKTTLIKIICENLGTVNQVSSPTFAIINEYKTDSDRSIYHFDFYRIEDLNELQQIGWEEYLDSGNYCFMEWSEKVEHLLDRNFVKVEIVIDQQQKRHLTY